MGAGAGEDGDGPVHSGRGTTTPVPRVCCGEALSSALAYSQHRKSTAKVCSPLMELEWLGARANGFPTPLPGVLGRGLC